jgi:hypothetical protein
MALSNKTRKILALKKEYNMLKEKSPTTTGVEGDSLFNLEGSPDYNRLIQLHLWFYPKERGFYPISARNWVHPLTGKKNPVGQSKKIGRKGTV